MTKEQTSHGVFFFLNLYDVKFDAGTLWSKPPRGIYVHPLPFKEGSLLRCIWRAPEEQIGLWSSLGIGWRKQAHAVVWFASDMFVYLH